VWFNNFAWTAGFYWRYMLLLKPHVFMGSWYIEHVSTTLYLATKLIFIVASPKLPGQPDDGESCIVLESGPTHSLAAKRLSFTVCKLHMQVMNAVNKATDMCARKTLLPDVKALEVHQNDSSYVSELSRSTFDSLYTNVAWQAVTQRTSKICRTSIPRTIQ